MLPRHSWTERHSSLLLISVDSCDTNIKAPPVRRDTFWTRSARLADVTSQEFYFKGIVWSLHTGGCALV